MHHAIVAAQPEPVEYIRVCDAYGTGCFFIPGSDTCLKIGGYIRTEVRFGRDISGTSDWSFFTRGQASFSSKSDTEWGTLTGLIMLRTNVDDNIDDETFLNEGYIDIAGLRVGMQYSWWDDDASGETDILATNDTRWNAIRYQYGSDNFDWFCRSMIYRMISRMARTTTAFLVRYTASMGQSAVISLPGTIKTLMRSLFVRLDMPISAQAS